MKTLQILQIIISSLLITTILLQSRGTGLSSIFGGSEFYQTKRGFEKTIFIATIILAIIFLGLGVITILIKK